MQHLNHSRTRSIYPQVRRGLTTGVKTRLKASNNLQNHQEPYKTCHNHAKVATSILTWQDSSTTDLKQLAGSKSKENTNIQLTDQTKTWRNPPQQNRSIKNLTEKSRAISNLPQPCKYGYNYPEKARLM